MRIVTTLKLGWRSIELNPGKKFYPYVVTGVAPVLVLLAALTLFADMGAVAVREFLL